MLLNLTLWLIVNLKLPHQKEEGRKKGTKECEIAVREVFNRSLKSKMLEECALEP